MHTRRRAPERGFTLIELLVVTVVIGVLSAILIPYLASALDRSRQRATMADLRTVATAIEQYRIDQGGYPVVGDVTALRDSIEPGYVREMPTLDGWGEPFLVVSEPDEYTLCSKGKDRLGDCTTEREGPTRELDKGIVLRLGHFVQWPEGSQQ